MPTRHYLEAVTVCVNYADFLAETIPANRVHLDRWLVVTSPDDQATLDLCHKHNLEVVVTRDFYRDGDSFNKGRAVERGLGMLAHDDWLMHLDADIALPGDFRDSLEDADLDPACIYGADRLIVQGWDAWQHLKSKGFLQRNWHCNLSANGYLIGSRWADIRYGYVPIGFFQLWNREPDHRKGIRLRRYPDNHQNAARADVKFALQWDRRQRQLLPEVLVAHLESQPAKNGANWTGRVTRLFGPIEQEANQASLSEVKDNGKTLREDAVVRSPTFVQAKQDRPTLSDQLLRSSPEACLRPHTDHHDHDDPHRPVS